MKKVVGKSDFVSLLDDLSVMIELMEEINSAEPYVRFMPQWALLRLRMEKMKIDIKSLGGIKEILI